MDEIQLDWALIQNGEVVNVIVASLEFIDSIRADYQHIEQIDTDPERGAAIGWSWDEVDGLRPPPAPAPEIDMRPEIVITSITSAAPFPLPVIQLESGMWDVTILEGQTVVIQAELQADGQKLPVNSVFRMPMQARNSGITIVYLVQMIDGDITINATLDDPKIWEVTEAQINKDLPPEQQMRFKGLSIQVVRSA